MLSWKDGVMPEAGDITRLLQEADQGHPEAANQLFVLVEQDLRRIARKRKRVAGVGVDVDTSTTVLVDDAFCRLVGRDAAKWQPGDRHKFFAYVSTKIHDMLIDRLREQQAQKRGGGQSPAPLEHDPTDAPSEGRGYLDLLQDLKAALERLQKFALEDAILFRIRFFLDCTFEETADIMGLSKTEAVRAFQRTKLWLQRELKEYNLDA
jgi:RNA polymerase sigma factor (TIGR02999 family)